MQQEKEADKETDREQDPGRQEDIEQDKEQNKQQDDEHNIQAGMERENQQDAEPDKEQDRETDAQGDFDADEEADGEQVQADKEEGKQEVNSDSEQNSQQEEESKEEDFEQDKKTHKHQDSEGYTAAGGQPADQPGTGQYREEDSNEKEQDIQQEKDADIQQDNDDDKEGQEAVKQAKTGERDQENRDAEATGDVDGVDRRRTAAESLISHLRAVTLWHREYDQNQQTIVSVQYIQCTCIVVTAGWGEGMTFSASTCWVLQLGPVLNPWPLNSVSSLCPVCFISPATLRLPSTVISSLFSFVS